MPVTLGRSQCGNLPLGELTWGGKIRNAARTEQGLAIIVRTFSIPTVVVQELDFAQGSRPAFQCAQSTGLPLLCSALLPAPEPALQGIFVSVLLGEHPSQTPWLWEFHADSTGEPDVEAGSRLGALPWHSHSLHCFEPGHCALVTLRWGETHREEADTEA